MLFRSGINYAKELLEKALGSDKAMDVIGKLTASLQVKPFEFVRKCWRTCFFRKFLPIVEVTR